jgi:acyl-coenzyme A synthetase/AMP-(fatty) acid ligase
MNGGGSWDCDYFRSTRVSYLDLKPKAGTDIAEPLDAHASSGLAPAKHSKRYEMSKALPRNSMGKVVKDTLYEELARLFA